MPSVVSGQAERLAPAPRQDVNWPILSPNDRSWARQQAVIVENAQEEGEREEDRAREARLRYLDYLDAMSAEANYHADMVEYFLHKARFGPDQEWIDAQDIDPADQRSPEEKRRDVESAYVQEMYRRAKHHDSEFLYYRSKLESGTVSFIEAEQEDIDLADLAELNALKELKQSGGDNKPRRSPPQFPCRAFR